jgi:uncharacterized repeat protein (TIGR03803 family)
MNRFCATTFLALLLLAVLAQAQTFTTLYNFTGGSDGGGPQAGVSQDRAGNLYGTAFDGGDLNCEDSYGCGVVFELNTAGTETVLYNFCSQTNCVDGEHPATPVVRDKAGNIYGTTLYGGRPVCGNYFCGTVFKIDAAGIETVLHSFDGSDGCSPYQGLVRDKTGNLYGTTWNCGGSGWGTVFKVDSKGNFTVLHSFAGWSSDGGYPQLGHLAMDKSGNLYGLTQFGGPTGCWGYGCGVLYMLSKRGMFTALHSFGGKRDGCQPFGSVVQDKAGNFYGTTLECGSNNYGTVWKVSRTGRETILHSFVGGSTDGCYPYAGVARDPKGNLYGVTTGCGAYGGGTLYELSACGKFTLLHSFDDSDGGWPLGEVLLTAKGTLFGTASNGGTGYCGGGGCGTVWSYVPK